MRSRFRGLTAPTVPLFAGLVAFLSIQLVVPGRALANDREVGRVVIASVWTCSSTARLYHYKPDGCLLSTSPGANYPTFCDSADQPISIGAAVLAVHSQGPIAVRVGSTRLTVTEAATSKTVFEGTEPIVYGLDDSRTAGGLSSPMTMKRLAVGTYLIRADYSGGQQVHHHGHGTVRPHGVLVVLPSATLTSRFVVADCSSPPVVAKVSRSMPSLELSTPTCTPGIYYRWTAYAGPQDGNRELTSADGCRATVFSRLDDVRVAKVALTRSAFPNTRWVVSAGVTADKIDYGDLPKVASRRIDNSAVWIREWSTRTRGMLNLDSLQRSTPYIAPDEDLDLLLRWLNWFGCDDLDRGTGPQVPSFSSWCRTYRYSLADAIIGEYAQVHSAMPSGAMSAVLREGSTPSACFTAFGEWQRLHREIEKLLDIRGDVRTIARNISLNEWKRMGEVGTVFLAALGAALTLYASVEAISLALAAGEATTVVAGMLAQIGLPLPANLVTAKLVADAIAFLTGLAQVVINLGNGQYSAASDPYGFQLASDSLALLGGFRLSGALTARGANVIKWVERGSTVYSLVSTVTQLADSQKFWGTQAAFFNSFSDASRLYQAQLGRSYRQAAVLKRSIDACNLAIG